MWRLVARAWPLVALAGTISAVGLAFNRREFDTGDDGWLLLVEGVSYLLAVIVLIVYTERWTLRGLAQVATYAADAGIYVGVGGAAVGLRSPLSDLEINLIRAGFVVGGPLLIISLIGWVVIDLAERRNRHGARP